MPPLPDRQDPNDPNSERHYSIPDEEGYYHVGDMRYNEHQYKLFFGTEEEQEQARNAHPSSSKRWPNGVLPYKFNSAVTSANQQMIKDCMAKFNQNFQGCLNVRYKIRSISLLRNYSTSFQARLLSS